MNNMLQKGIQKSDTRRHNGLALVVPTYQTGYVSWLLLKRAYKSERKTWRLVVLFRHSKDDVMLIMQHVSRPASEPSTNIALLDAPGSRSFVKKHDTYHYSLVSLVKSEVSRLPCNLVRLGRVRPRRVANWCVVWGATKNFLQGTWWADN